MKLSSPIILFIILISGIFIFINFNGSWGLMKNTVSIDTGGSPEYKIVLYVEGEWIHYPLFLEDQVHIKNIDYKIESAWSLTFINPFKLSSADQDKGKLEFLVYDGNGKLLDDKELEFTMEQGSWRETFILMGFTSGHYKITVKAYQWYDPSWAGIITGEKPHWIYRDSYTLEVDI